MKLRGKRKMTARLHIGRPLRKVQRGPDSEHITHAAKRAKVLAVRSSLKAVCSCRETQAFVDAAAEL